MIIHVDCILSPPFSFPSSNGTGVSGSKSNHKNCKFTKPSFYEGQSLYEQLLIFGNTNKSTVCFYPSIPFIYHFCCSFWCHFFSCARGLK